MNKLKNNSLTLMLFLVILFGGTILTSLYTFRAYEVTAHVLHDQGQNIS